MPASDDSTRILAIHAHPDDIEFQCAGTLARLSQSGCRITMATMTPGDCGSAEMGPEEISSLRRVEAQTSADLLGADYICLEFRDLSIVHDNESRRRVTEVLRRVRPEIVITAPWNDYMSDHEMTGRLVRDACFNVAVPNYTTHAPEPAAPCNSIPHLYFVDSLEGEGHYGSAPPPEFIIDISSTFEFRQKMLACHESQRNWLRSQHGIDEYLESARRWAARRGQEIGAEFGEGFTQYRGHAYPADNLLLKLLSN